MVHQPSASLLRYQAYLDAKGRRARSLPHWFRLRAVRWHQPERPDQLAELWDAWVDAHNGDVAAALGALVADHVDRAL